MTKTTNVDFFKANKTLSTRTSDYFKKVLKRAELNEIYNAKITLCNQQIEAYENALNDGSKIKGLDSKEVIAERIKEQETAREGYATELAELKEKNAFILDDNDKLFKKNVSKAEGIGQVKSACEVFFKSYNLDIKNTEFENAIIESIGKKSSVKKLVKTGGTKTLMFDGNNALKNMYAVSFEYMVEKGTIKPAQIPSVLRHKYEKKSAKKSNK